MASYGTEIFKKRCIPWGSLDDGSRVSQRNLAFLQRTRRWEALNTYCVSVSCILPAAEQYDHVCVISPKPMAIYSDWPFHSRKTVIVDVILICLSDRLIKPNV